MSDFNWIRAPSMQGIWKRPSLGLHKLQLVNKAFRCFRVRDVQHELKLQPFACKYKVILTKLKKKPSCPGTFYKNP